MAPPKARSNDWISNWQGPVDRITPQSPAEGSMLAEILANRLGASASSSPYLQPSPDVARFKNAGPIRAPLSMAPPPPKESHPVLDAIGKIWGAPNTALGLGAAGLSWLAGKYVFDTDPKFKIDNNAIQLLNSPLNLNDRAYTLGNVQIYAPGDGPDKDQMSYTRRVVNNGRHEEGHTLQSQFMGPFYVPLQLGGMLLGDQNPWDVGADDYALGKSRTGF